MRLSPLLLVAAVTGLFGCSSSEDGRFRAEVGPVLKQCNELGAELGVWGVNSRELRAETERTDAVISKFEVAVRGLPQARDKRLRYLAIRLSALAASAREMVAARINALDALNSSTLPGVPIGGGALPEGWMDKWTQEQSEREGKFGAALSYVVAGERVALGTSAVRDAMEASYLGGREPPSGQTREQRDSIFAETERLVRLEIAGLR